MDTPQGHLRATQGMRRRALLHAGLAAGVTVSAWPLARPPALWGGDAGSPRRGGILRVRGYDPPHFDHQLSGNFKTNMTLSFIHSTLLRYKVGPVIVPGPLTVEPHLAERWETPDDTTYVFHLRRGVKWHQKPPVNGRELVADDVKFTFDRFLTEPGNPARDLLESVERVEVVDRYTVQFVLQDILSNGTFAVYMRTDQPPFTDVRVRRAISMAIDRQALIEAVAIRGQPTPAIAPGAAQWSLPIEQLGAGAQYYQYNPTAARRLLAEAGVANGFKTPLTVSTGYGRDVLDAGQLVQSYLKEVGIAAELKLQEYGAYIATTARGKFEGLAYGPFPPAWEPDRLLYGSYVLDLNFGHVSDATITALLKEQRRTKDLEARRRLIFDLQRYEAEQQYYVYLYAGMLTVSWPPYVKNYAPNLTWDVGGRVAALWLDR